jgi:hypothetical protein
MAGKNKFGALKELRQGQGHSQDVEETSVAAVLAPAVAVVKAPKGPGRPAGKRSNPDFESTTVFLRKATKKSANRTLEDNELGMDLSDLLESLLQEWLGKHS